MTGDAAASAVHAGALLREAREAHGLHVAAMAFSLKVPVAKLEALEAGRLDLLPDVTFARGLAATICRNLKLDPAPVLELLPRNAAARMGVEAPSINTPFRPPGDGPSFAARGRLFSPAVMAVMALLVGAVLLLVWPSMHEDTSVANEPPPPPLMDPTAAAPQEPASVPVVETPAPAESSPALAASAPAIAVPAAGLFAVTARGESWVKVTDAKGVVGLNRVVKPGETVQLDGTPPLAVVVGRADEVQVQVRGQPLDIKPMTKVNVARFEVK
ncbi:hypothetical protein RD110_18255 [Rhodoferax koreense]|uniref:Cytoskeleton protein RodZ-like C-terminal domain-containing protein n=2 Tax=Rhodoferax koreensis TaxID=1842727 RepID=A0A1P8K440_9BURK|nr:hypothetical protein RD110_18255 [Rhodoferax koreense]